MNEDLKVFDIFLTTTTTIKHNCHSKLQLGLNRGEIEALPPHDNGKSRTVAGLPQIEGLARFPASRNWLAEKE